MKLSSLLLFPLIFFISVSQTIQYSSVLSLAPSPSPFPLCHPTESSALLHFKNSFSIDYNDVRPGLTNPKTLYWKDGTNCCAWDGVLCDNISGRVISLNLSYSLLDGPFLSNNSLFLLRHLQVLILSQNDFHGSPIPSEFGGFPDMIELSLAYSNFSGLIPSELCYLSKLVTLDLSSTVTYFFDKRYFPLELRLETYIFEKLVRNLTNLMQLSLAYVNMFEVAPIFMNISSSLTYLDLSFCNLKGKFPESTFRLPSLQILSLENNIGIIGSLPTYNWSTPLRYLILSNTRILVDLPYLTRSAKFLKVLYLKNSSFTGSYPALLGNLTQISDLDLSFNGFGGQIPWSSLNLEQLRSLDLRGNNFFGQLPEVYGNNSNKIPFMYDSSKRQVVGPVPLNLQALYLSDNLLNGPIPSWTFSLPFLGALYLNENQLNGSIPEFQYRSMQILNLAYNKLHGQVPSSIFQQDNLNLLLLQFNSLSGVIELNMFSKLKNLQFLSLSFNNLSLSSNSYVGSPIPQVRQLALSSCNITKFPYFLSSVENLQALDLSHNKLQGSIPKWLWNEGTTYLSTLNLSHNLLTHVERIPLKNLMYLDLRSNLLQGHLPVLPPSVGVFFISNNKLNGEIIPSLFCNFSHMWVLDLSNNSLHGKLPSCIGNWTTLSVLDLRMNKFHGIIPDTFANTELLSLRSLHLNDNQLEGPLPRSLLNCKNLEVLDVGNNKISDTFPQWLESLMMLQVLILRSNRFHGSIGNPKIKSPFQKLRIMDLSGNQFNGLLPTKYLENLMAMMEAHADGPLAYVIGERYYQDSVIVVMKDFEYQLVKILSIFTTLDFSRNNFEGEIPNSIGKLKSLKGLNFSHNKLAGHIPPSLGDLSNLEWLDLSSNEFVGVIPRELADLTFLSFLNLSHNKLEGPIPIGKQFNTFNNDSYFGNLGLCGFPLEQCSKHEAQEQGDQEEDTIELDWKIIMMGFGSGLVIGISIGYMVLTSPKVDYWFMERFGGGWQARSRRKRRN